MALSSRKTKSQTVGEALETFLATYKLKSKFNETYLVAYWEKFMGVAIAARTEKIYISRGILFIRISSSPLRQELILAKSRIIAMLNKEIGEETVKDVVFI